MSQFNQLKESWSNVADKADKVKLMATRQNDHSKNKQQHNTTHALEDLTNI